jgi:hypothetical protein
MPALRRCRRSGGGWLATAARTSGPALGPSPDKKTSLETLDFGKAMRRRNWDYSPRADGFTPPFMPGEGALAASHRPTRSEVRVGSWASFAVGPNKSDRNLSTSATGPSSRTLVRVLDRTYRGLAMWLFARTLQFFAVAREAECVMAACLTPECFTP